MLSISSVSLGSEEEGVCVGSLWLIGLTLATRAEHFEVMFVGIVYLGTSGAVLLVEEGCLRSVRSGRLRDRLKLGLL